MPSDNLTIDSEMSDVSGQDPLAANGGPLDLIACEAGAEQSGELPAGPPVGVQARSNIAMPSDNLTIDSEMSDVSGQDPLAANGGPLDLIACEAGAEQSGELPAGPPVGVQARSNIAMPSDNLTIDSEMSDVSGQDPLAANGGPLDLIACEAGAEQSGELPAGPPVGVQAGAQVDIDATPGIIRMIPTHTPRYQQHAVKERRVKSFSTWPLSVPLQNTQVLAESGFIYLGSGDRVVCYQCGGGLKDWGETADPWKEHDGWFRDCDYIKAMKDEGGVEQSRETTPRESVVIDPQDIIVCGEFMSCAHVRLQ